MNKEGVEKMGCKGCHYDKKNIEEVIEGLESLIDDRLSFLAPDDYKDEDNIFINYKYDILEWDDEEIQSSYLFKII